MGLPAAAVLGVVGLIRLRAERRLAEIVDQGQAAGTIEAPGGDRKSINHRAPVVDALAPERKPEKLADLGIEQRRLSEARKLAALSDAQLVAAATQASEDDRELTRSSLLKEAARIRVPESRR